MAVYGFLCITPRVHCSGTPAKLNAGLEKRGLKKHGSPNEAMCCYASYLENVVGCEKLSDREFRHPNGGPIEVLTRASRFGCVLRSGKRGDNMGTGSDRGMPKSHAAIISG
jgi:hypothetical protein